MKVNIQAIKKFYFKSDKIIESCFIEYSNFYLLMKQPKFISWITSTLTNVTQNLNCINYILKFRRDIIFIIKIALKDIANTNFENRGDHTSILFATASRGYFL